jgi:hypothetical protein
MDHCLAHFLGHAQVRRRPMDQLALVDLAPHGHVPAAVGQDFDPAVDYVIDAQERKHAFVGFASLVRSAGGTLRDLAAGPSPLPVVP